jgi:hypothetical protein
MEAVISSETSVDTQRTTRRYIPEDGTLQYNISLRSDIWVLSLCEDLTAYKVPRE